MNRALQEGEVAGVVLEDDDPSSPLPPTLGVPTLAEDEASRLPGAHYRIGTIDPRPVVDRLLKAGVQLRAIEPMDLCVIEQPTRRELEGRRIAIFGAGITGLNVCSLLKDSCEIVALVDNSPDGREPFDGRLPVQSADMLADLAFDRVVICSSAWPTIAAQLMEMRIPEEKIGRFARWMLPDEGCGRWSVVRALRRLTGGD